MPGTLCVSPARRGHRSFALAIALLVLAIAPVAHSQVWNEVGDAGDLVSSAQVTAGSGGLTTINGILASPTDVDLYCIHLSAVPPSGQPLVSLQCVALMGPNVWLFDATGLGVFTNATCALGNKTILAPNVSLAPGTYYLAVSYYGLDPFSAAGAIWLPALFGQRAPDGPGGAGSLTAWSGAPTVSPINPYQINLTFMQYCDAATALSTPTWGSLKIRYGS
jgi:hypothetical protein